MKHDEKKDKGRAKAAQSAGEVAKEIGELGRKVEQALKSAAASKHVSGLKTEISKGVRNVGRKLSDALGALNESEESQELKSQVKRVLSTGRKQSAAASKQVASNIVAGLGVLSKELSRLAGKIEKK